MKMLKFVLFLTVIAFLPGCAAKKRAAEYDAQPAWVKQKPVVDGYFTGVGSSKKTGTRLAYIERARRDALADLAGEVAVQVSSSSVLRKIETEYGITDLFTQRIDITADDYLEGFEPVDSYENETTYWVYYRIKKSTYYAAKAKRKQQAVAAARAKLEAGQEAQQNRDPAAALTFYLQGLTAIKAYLGEETPADIGGQTVDVGNKLFSSLNRTLSDLKIKPVTTTIEVKRGRQPEHPPQFEVTYQKQPVKDIPVLFKFSGGYLVNDRALTDEKGRVTAALGKINSKNDSELLTATIDLSGLAQKATEDQFIRSLPDYRKIEKATIRINIVSPKILLLIRDGFCGDNDCDAITGLFRKNCLQAGLNFTQEQPVDYRFVLDLKYTDGESAGGLTSVFISGKLSVFDGEQEMVRMKNITAIKGVGSNKTEAREKAFAELLKNLDLIYFRQGLDALE